MKTLHRIEESTDTDTATAFRRDEPTSDAEAESSTMFLTMRRVPRRHLELDVRLRPIQRLLHRIVDLELLPSNWDGHGGRPATLEAINGALQVFGQHRELLSPPLVSARGDGGIHLEWLEPACEVDVEPDGLITVLVENADDWDDYEFTSPADAELHELLDRLNS